MKKLDKIGHALQVSHAFHSALMHNMEEDFRCFIGTFTKKLRISSFKNDLTQVLLLHKLCVKSLIPPAKMYLHYFSVRLQSCLSGNAVKNTQLYEKEQLKSSIVKIVDPFCVVQKGEST